MAASVAAAGDGGDGGRHIPFGVLASALEEALTLAYREVRGAGPEVRLRVEHSEQAGRSPYRVYVRRGDGAPEELLSDGEMVEVSQFAVRRSKHVLVDKLRKAEGRGKGAGDAG